MAPAALTSPQPARVPPYAARGAARPRLTVVAPSAYEAPPDPLRIGLLLRRGRLLRARRLPAGRHLPHVADPAGPAPGSALAAGRSGTARGNLSGSPRAVLLDPLDHGPIAAAVGGWMRQPWRCR